MKKTVKTILSMLILCTFLMPLHIQAGEIYKLFAAKRFDAYLDTVYFKTQANYGPNGDKQSLTANSGLQDINLQTSARYLFLNDLGLYSGLNFNNIESSNGSNVRSNSILTRYFIGGDFQFFQTEKWSLYGDVSYLISNEKIDLNQDTAIASNGANEIKALLVGTAKFESFRSFAKLGADYRTEGLSSLLLYGFGGEFLTGNSAVGAEAEGSSTIKDDQNTNTPSVRDNLTNRVNAGSRIYDSINPNLLDGIIYYSFAFDPNLILKLSGGATLLGSNSAAGYHAGVSVNWGFGGASGSIRSGKKPAKDTNNTSSISDDDPGFKIDTDDGVNQDLFKRVEPVKPKK